MYATLGGGKGKRFSPIPGPQIAFYEIGSKAVPSKESVAISTIMEQATEETYPRVLPPAVHTPPPSRYLGEAPWKRITPKPAPAWRYGEGAELAGVMIQPPRAKKWAKRRPRPENEARAARVIRELAGTASPEALAVLHERLLAGNVSDPAAYLAKIERFQASGTWQLWTVVAEEQSIAREHDLKGWHLGSSANAGRSRRRELAATQSRRDT